MGSGPRKCRIDLGQESGGGAAVLKEINLELDGYLDSRKGWATKPSGNTLELAHLNAIDC